MMTGIHAKQPSRGATTDSTAGSSGGSDVGKKRPLEAGPGSSSSAAASGLAEKKKKDKKKALKRL